MKASDNTQTRRPSLIFSIMGIGCILLSYTLLTQNTGNESNALLIFAISIVFSGLASTFEQTKDSRLSMSMIVLHAFSVRGFMFVLAAATKLWIELCIVIAVLYALTFLFFNRSIYYICDKRIVVTPMAEKMQFIDCIALLSWFAIYVILPNYAFGVGFVILLIMLITAAVRLFSYWASYLEWTAQPVD